MTIDFSKLRSLTIRQLVTALKRDGFVVERRRGRRRVLYRHPDGRRVTVHQHHSGQTLPIGTLQRFITVEARWTEEDLRRLELLK